jgi:uncharacterized protein
MKRHSYIWTGILLTLLCGPISACAGGSGPSFDCGKASTDIEKTICADKDLSEADRSLALRYSELSRILKPGEKKELVQTQKTWLRQRDKECSRLSTAAERSKCLKERYSQRIAELAAWDKKPAGESSPPKYPDVWGMKLPVPPEAERVIEKGGDVGCWGLFKDKEGDLILAYTYDLENTAYVVRLISFFTGNIIHEIPYPPLNQIKDDDRRFEEYLAHQELIKIKEFDEDEDSLKDGGKLRHKSEAPGGHCDQPISSWFIKYNAQSKEEFRKIIVLTTPKPRLFITSSECTIMDGEEEAWVHSTSFFPSPIWDLEDGTYLIKDFERQHVIRLKPDFTSPYIEKSNELVQLDAAEALKKLEEVQNEVIEKGYEGEYGTIWVRGKIEGCTLPVECEDRLMTEYFQKLISEKRGRK